MPAEVILDRGPYRTWVFDCDGVLLDSNQVKTEAFRLAVLDYGQDVAGQLVDYHVANGGISRFKKFDYFFENILARSVHAGEMETVLARFSEATKQGLLTCDEAPGLRALLAAIPEDQPRIVVSGGAQDELREVFAKRGLAQYFTAIFGSPDTKETIFSRELSCGTLIEPAVYIGDSLYDYRAAMACNLDFIFVTGWSEFAQWEEFFADKNVRIIDNVSALFNMNAME